MTKKTKTKKLTQLQYCKQLILENDRRTLSNYHVEPLARFVMDMLVKQLNPSLAQEVLLGYGVQPDKKLRHQADFVSGRDVSMLLHRRISEIILEEFPQLILPRDYDQLGGYLVRKENNEKL